MSDGRTATFTFANDGAEIVVDRTLPDGEPKGALIVAHGMAEHAERYLRFASELAAHGYAVYAPDLRGHARTAGGAERFGRAGKDAWNGMVRDLARLAQLVRERHPGAPLFLFGHSMGSVLAQRFAQLHGAELAGLILSGTFGSAPKLAAAIVAARVVKLFRGSGAPSPLQRAMFAGFNAAFEPRTGFEWLSRDEAEVRKYADDPRCGFTFSNGLMLDMLLGYARAWKAADERRIPPDLPVLLFAGARDPVARNGDAITELAERYRALGLRDVHVHVYPEARHEMLNETNRDEVVRDVLAWLDARAQSKKMSSASGVPGSTA